MFNVLLAILLVQAAANGQHCGTEGCAAKDHTLLSVRTSLHRSSVPKSPQVKGAGETLEHAWPEVEEVCGNPDGQAPDQDAEELLQTELSEADQGPYTQFQMQVSIEWCTNGCHQSHDPPHCVTNYSAIKARAVSSTQSRFSPWFREYGPQSGHSDPKP